MKRTIRLCGLAGPHKGRAWEATDLMRVGRLESLEIVLDDSSVSRTHAEVRATERGWRVRDLGSTNGTRLNGVRLGDGQWPLRARDLLQFGEVAVVVDSIQDDIHESDREPGQETMRVAATARASWNDAVEGLAFDSNRAPRPGEQLIALLRAGQHFVHLGREQDLLDQVLSDAVTVLDAQRGAIVLAEEPEGRLKLRSLVSGKTEPRAVMAGRTEPSARFQFSQSLANRCFSRGESILCHSVEEDPELALARSIAEGAMASVVCVLLRTPRGKLGVLHLDRSPWQKPFTTDDLRLADALAAHASAGIECSLLLRKQRDMFLETIISLAQAIEQRDKYTGGHTFRVTRYSILLAQHLKMNSAELEWIQTGTPLHDIGKIGIDDAILRKPDRLTHDEFEQMKLHTVKGEEIILPIQELRPVLPIVRSHHERWDGKGYPDGLEAEAISPMARVVALADAFDAMTSDRPYRSGMPPLAAFAEIEKQSGKQFDPTFAAGFLQIRESILREMQTQPPQTGGSTLRHVVAPSLSISKNR